MPRLPEPPAEIALASFKVLEGSGAGGAAVAVQFNPASLEYTLSNEFDSSAGNNGARQFVKKTSGKLAMTLVYDTTDDGSDVRGKTEQISRLLEPAPSGDKKFAPKVEFAWGTYKFSGVIEQYKETIDFFSDTGVPLRASIALTLASQEVEFQSAKNPPAQVDRDLPADPVAAPAGTAPAQAAQAAGDPRAARGIADASGAGSLRFGAEAGLSVGGGISLAAAASFSAGAGLGLGGGAGLGVGGGLSLGGGLDVSATAGPAFAGLRVSPPSVSVSTESARAALLPQASASCSGFTVGGRAQVLGGTSLTADVGADADLHANLKFE